MSDLIGQRLGQYEILEFIAKGGMATVYRARQKSRDVAIKILPSAMTHDDTFMERFNREAEIVMSLQHPHILPVYDFGEQDGMPYIVMAYMRGGTLADVIQRGPMPVHATERMIRQIAGALDYAHNKGIIHRDFKPGNVLLDDQSNCYLTDFGLARMVETSSELTGMTILGTPSYMAPEQSEPGEVTRSVDVYALGVTLFQMLTGRVPYEATTPLAVLMAHVQQPIPNVHSFRSDLPDGMEIVIAKAMAKSPEARYKSTKELADELTQTVEGKTVTATKEVAEGAPVAMVMTNMLGQVIFVDQFCLRLIKRHYHEARHIVGKPLHEVLGFSRAVTDQLMQEIAKTGRLDEYPLDICDSQGKAIPVLLSATGTRDDKGNFVGADITLDAVGQTVEQVTMKFETLDKRLDTMEETYLQTYFRGQLQGLLELLVQLGGKRLGKNLEAIVNQTAERNVWPVHVQDGQIQVELRNSDGDIYRALLAKSIAYAVNVIGKRPVAKQMQTVDKRLDSQVVEFVGKLGLRDQFNDLL
jgi:tRNA A-37 threonylcarbamoyl transferase component Bud32